jgi:hypothetical protein
MQAEARTPTGTSCPHSGKLWFDYGKNGIEFFPVLAHPVAVSVFTINKLI